MLTGSVEGIFSIINSGIALVGGSIGEISGQGIGSIADLLNPLLDGLATGSGATAPYVYCGSVVAPVT